MPRSEIREVDTGSLMPGFSDADPFARSAAWVQHYTPDTDAEEEAVAEVYGAEAFATTEMSLEASQYYWRLLGIPYSWEDTVEGDVVREP